MTAETAATKNVLFVRCGERQSPVGDEDVVLTLDAAMDAQKAKDSVALVRAELAKLGRHVELRVAGPGILWGMYAQAFEHSPIRIEYSQLNQLSKQYEIWFSNSENL